MKINSLILNDIFTFTDVIYTKFFLFTKIKIKKLKIFFLMCILEKILLAVRISLSFNKYFHYRNTTALIFF